MRARKTLTTLAAVIFVFANVLLSGCSDSTLLGDQEQLIEEGATSKMRQAHLFKFLSRGKVLERYEELAASNDFVLGMSKVLERYRVLERYEGMEGVTVKRDYKRVFDGFAAHVEDSKIPAFLDAVEGDPDIEWIEPDISVTTGRPKASRFKNGKGQVLPWNLDHIDAELSSAVSGDGSGKVSSVDIFVFDSGVKGHDVELVSYFRNGGTDDGLAFVNGDARDQLGHGTHIAGTAAAKDDDEGVVGIAPGANLHNFKVLDDNGITDLSTVIAAVEYVTDLKAADPSRAMVVNISFGGDIGTTEYNALDQAIAESIKQGVVYVIAAGNEGVDASTVTPAHVAEAITVGSYGKDNKFSDFSNYGPMVDLMAPGEYVLSSSNATGAKIAPVLMSGTSMAAPHVTGTAALYLSQNTSATPAEVRDALLASAKPWVMYQPASTTNLSVYAGDF